MADEDVAIWTEIRRASTHLIQAHFGGFSAQARAGLYVRAALLFTGVVELLLDRAEQMRGEQAAEAMVKEAFR